MVSAGRSSFSEPPAAAASILKAASKKADESVCTATR
jgi:hypothetical protein